MGTYEDDAPRLSEIGRMLGGLDRKMDDFRGEVRAALNDKVSKETYLAERAGFFDKLNNMNDRILTLEAGARATNNRIYGGLATIITGVILYYIGTR